MQTFEFPLTVALANIISGGYHKISKRHKIYFNRLVEEIANSLSDVEKDQLNNKPLYQKSEEWQNILLKKKKINQFDQPIKMEFDKIPSQEVGRIFIEIIYSVENFSVKLYHSILA